MKKIPGQHMLFPLLISISILAGCSKSSSNPVVLSPEQIPATMNQAFKQSSGETKDLVDNCVAASQNQDAITAFRELQKLSGRNDLTPDQRATAARAMTATVIQLRAASEKGNPAAQALLHQYLSTR